MEQMRSDMEQLKSRSTSATENRQSARALQQRIQPKRDIIDIANQQ